MKCKVKKKINLIQSSKISSVDKGMTISRKSNTSYYDTFIEETGKIVKIIEKNHNRLFSEDHSNMRHNQKIQIDEMNKEWHTTPKCTVAETVGHRIVLTSKFKIWQEL